MNVWVAVPEIGMRRTNEAVRIAVVAAMLLLVAALLASRTRIAELLGPRARPRVIDARLTIEPPSGRRLNASLAELTDRSRREPTAANLHELAVAELGRGHTATSRELLARAAHLRPDDASIVADLGAVTLALGRVADAAEESARAVALDPTSAVAAFNWALSLEQLSNRPAAVNAWHAYLALDPSGSFAGEARQHLARLEAPRARWEDERALLRPGVDTATFARLLSTYPQRVRARTMNVLLPAWVRDGGASELALLERIAAARAAAGDPLLRDVLEQATPRSTPIVAAFAAYAAAEDASFRGANKDEVVRLYDAAAKSLRDAGSPLASVAAIYAASNADYAGRGEEALARIAALQQDLDENARRRPSVVAEAEWVRALVLVRMGSPHEALEAFRRALDAAKRCGEIEHEAALTALLATQLDLVGEPDEADEFRRQSLRRNDEVGAHPERMYVAFNETASSALRAGRPRVALAFTGSAERIARAEAAPLLIAECAAQRAEALLAVGDPRRAAVAISGAHAEALQIETAGLRDRVLADIDYAAAAVHRRAGDLRAARDAYASAIAIWETYGWRVHLARGYVARGEAALAANDRAAAEHDFRACIAEMEQQRSDLEPALRVSYFERADRAFERLIELLVDEGRPDEALTIAERKRARLLLDAAGANRRGTPLAAAEIARAVPANAAILEIALLDRGPELWLIRDGAVRHARGAASRAGVEAAAQRHLDAIRGGDEAAVRREGRRLFEQLVAPVAAWLPREGDLVVVADGVLQTLPFATLTTPDGAYLVDRYALASAPSASVFLRRTDAAAGESVLAVAEPAPEGFEALRHALPETSAIAREYRRGRMLAGADVTPREFLAAAGDASCVHFAGHARVDADRPSRSALLFESRDGAPAALTAEAIAAERLDNHPLIVLAACSTARGRLRRNEGIDSLAAAFLQAGARGVVATLWDVADEPAGLLFRAFHRNLRAGARPADALRAAQRALLRGSDARGRSPAAWGSAVLTGTL